MNTDATGRNFSRNAHPVEVKRKILFRSDPMCCLRSSPTSHTHLSRIFLSSSTACRPFRRRRPKRPQHCVDFCLHIPFCLSFILLCRLFSTFWCLRTPRRVFDRFMDSPVQRNNSSTARSGITTSVVINSRFGDGNGNGNGNGAYYKSEVPRRLVSACTYF